MNPLLTRWLAVVTCVCFATGCPPRQIDPDRPVLPIKDVDDNAGDKTQKKPDIPAVPVNLNEARRKPMDGHDPAARSPVLDIMLSETKRSLDVLSRQQLPAYYLAYQIHDQRTVVIETEGGALTTYVDDVDRQLDTEVRVGGPKLDNRHQLSSEQQQFINGPLPRRGMVPFGADEQALRHHLWLDTDRRYREAELSLRAVLTDKSVTAQQDSPPDFVYETREEYIEPVKDLKFDKNALIARARACSKNAFRGVATRATCRIDLLAHTVYFANAEGTLLQMSQTSARLSISVGVKSDDGMPLTRLEQRFARDPSGLPDNAEMEKMIAVVTADLDALHKAPVVDPYVGPAILEGRAAGVFFHEVFGHRIEGHRQKLRTNGQTFTSKIGKSIAPDWLTVYDDPTLTDLNGVALHGFYRFDDEGVRARRVSLVKNGVLEGFVMGRNPIKNFPHSNGHGRKEPGKSPVSRQGNLVVVASRTVEQSQLEKELLAEVQRQGKPFGMVFTDISGGFTNMSRFIPQAFKVNPIMAYRVYPDGRRELVRGVDIVGTPLTAMASLMMASREMETFNGMCGAESGWVPVSASAPSMLLQSLEIERGFKSVDRPPVLPPPAIGTGSPGTHSAGSATRMEVTH